MDPPFTAIPGLIAVGPWHDGEFAALRDELDPHRRWPTAAALDDALLCADALPSPPELILLAHPRPAAVDQTAVESWRALYPLARVIVVAGSWCEGEIRTGRPLAGVVRLYWHELAPWWRASLARLAQQQCPPWSAPLDDVRAGRWIEPDHSPWTNNQPAHVLAVDAVDYAVFETIASVVANHDWRCLWQPRHRPDLWQVEASEIAPHAGLWDGSQLDPAQQRHLKRFCARLASHNAPVVALLDFPRPEHIELAKSSGAHSIMGKPYLVANLTSELSRLHPSGPRPLAGQLLTSLRSPPPGGERSCISPVPSPWRGGLGRGESPSD